MTKPTCWICQQAFKPGERIIRGGSPRHGADSERCTFTARPADEVPEKLRAIIAEPLFEGTVLELEDWCHAKTTPDMLDTVIVVSVDEHG